MKFLATYTMQGRMPAIMVASVAALLSLILPPVSIVSSASVALVTLRRGAAEGWYLLIAACLACALLGIFLFGSYQFPLLYGLTLWTPVWLIAIILREGRHLLLAIEIVILIAALSIIGAYLYQPQLASFWETWINDLLKLNGLSDMETLMVKSNPDVPVPAIRHALSMLYHFVMTGLVAQTYVVGLLAGLFLGRWWQAILYNPGGFKQEYLTLQGQPALAIVTVVIMAMAWFTSGIIAEICANISILLFVLYTLIGSIILQSVFSNMKMSHFTVPFLYVTLMLIPQAMIPVAIIGLADTWLNLRNKLNKPSV